MPRFDTVYWPGLDDGYLASSKLSITDAGNDLAATNVDTAISELANNATAANNHLIQAVGAHAATAISIADTGGNYAGTNVETALTEAAGRLDVVEGDATSLDGRVTTIENDYFVTSDFQWQTDWTPTFQANASYAVPTVGNGTWSAKYLRVGDVGFISAIFTAGSTTALTNKAPDINMPTGWTANGIALGKVVMSREPNQNTINYCSLSVGDTNHGWSTQRGSTTIIKSWIYTSTTDYVWANSPGYTVSMADNTADQTLLYNIGPIPLA
jgi:hypothetical protein